MKTRYSHFYFIFVQEKMQKEEKEEGKSNE